METTAAEHNLVIPAQPNTSRSRENRECMHGAELTASSRRGSGGEWLLITHSLYVLGVSLEWIMKPSLRRVSEAMTAKLSPAMARIVLCTERMCTCADSSCVVLGEKDALQNTI